MNVGGRCCCYESREYRWFDRRMCVICNCNAMQLIGKRANSKGSDCEVEGGPS